MNKKYVVSVFVVVITILLISCKTSTRFDILILNGTIYNGVDDSSFVGDIGIVGDEIVEIGKLQNSEAVKVIDASGYAVSPGFIDLHTHLDPIFKLPECESHLRQGVTLALGGPDGGGPSPFGVYLDSLEKVGVSMNVAFLVGHNTVRKNVMSLENRAPTSNELLEMKSQIKDAMNEGAFGISTGLKYLPGAFSKVDEVIELSKVAAKYGGIYTSHLREEGLGLIDAVKEAIQISKDANITVVLTHHKVIGSPMWGKSKITLGLVDSARWSGLDVRIDQYPYDASYTGISILIPSWARAGGNKAFKERIKNKKLRRKIKSEIVFNILNDRGGADLSRVQFAKVGWKKELEGKTLADWCKIKGIKPSIENGADLVIEAQLNGGASCIFHAMDEKDVIRIMQHPQTMIASDGRLVKPGVGHPHPRWYGTFPRVLGHYVRELEVLTLNEAIKKMTSMPANTLEISDRGVLAEGKKADVVIFNPETVIDKATFEKPHQYPIGIDYVLVNGKLAVDSGKFVDARSGKVVRKKH